MKIVRRSIFPALLLAALASTAAAYSPAAHMVSGAIAYDELRTRHPAVLGHIVKIMAQHPDRGSFAVALDRSTGDERTLQLLMEMARWPDDVRKGAYDHPTWHYASKPLIDPQRPPPGNIPGAAAGSAIEAFALNLSVARDPGAPAPERAIALCWIFHLVGDMHQPLHAADRYSADHPQGDHGGGLDYVIDPRTRAPMSLHWFWDQSVDRPGDTAAARATALVLQHPRSDFKQLAVALTPGYAANAARVAEKQLTLAGYRLADLLAGILP